MRVCQFRHFGKSDSAAAIAAAFQESNILQHHWRRNAAAGAMLPGMLLLSTHAKTRIRTTASKRRIVGETIQEYDVPEIAMENSTKLPDDVTQNLRRLAHDLSNSIETILQAAYLLGQAKLEANTKKWAQLIDTAAQDAARINREIREILRSQS